MRLCSLPKLCQRGFLFRFWTTFVAVLRFSGIFGSGYSVASLACIHSLKSVNVVFNTNCAGRPCTLESAKSLTGRYITKSLNSIYFQTNKIMHLLWVHWHRNHKSINIARAVFIWVSIALATLHDWLKKLAPIFHPIRRKTKTNRDSLARVFPHFASATCNCFESYWFTVLCVLFVIG